MQPLARRFPNDGTVKAGNALLLQGHLRVLEGHLQASQDSDYFKRTLLTSGGLFPYRTVMKTLPNVFVTEA